tara:strand:- start:103 stop:342 length:240 start_codon:yes stop_codon:yes gene_type:complete
MSEEENSDLKKQASNKRPITLDLFDGTPKPERKFKASSLKKKKKSISTNPQGMNEELKKELTNQLQSILNDIEQATDNT